MKLSVTQENLSRALGTVSRIASQRGSLPILSNVLLKTVNNQLYIAATNLDVAISETIGAKVTKEGSITVPARLMQDYIASLPASTLVLEVKENKLTMTTDHHNSSINGTPADDFPVMPSITNGSELSLGVEDFKTALSQVLFAASGDDSRPVLTGIYLHSDNGQLIAAATDSYRLAEKKIIKYDQDLNLLIPASSLQEVLRVMRDDSGNVTIKYDEQQVIFTIGTIELVSRLIEGKYPDYKKLLPSEAETKVLIKRQDLQEITKYQVCFAREAAGGITMSASEETGELSIRSIASQVGENNAVAEGTITGEATITLNSRYVLDALGAFSGNEILISINGKLDPCILTDPKAKDYLHVVMPVKVRGQGLVNGSWGWLSD